MQAIQRRRRPGKLAEQGLRAVVDTGCGVAGSGAGGGQIGRVAAHQLGLEAERDALLAEVTKLKKGN